MRVYATISKIQRIFINNQPVTNYSLINDNFFSKKIAIHCRDKPACGVFIYVTPVNEQQNKDENRYR